MKSLYLKIKVYERVHDYCKVNGECKELEQLIGTHWGVSFYYAFYILKGRFELGEGMVATNTSWSYSYAKDIIGNRFELGEEMITRDAYWNCKYREFLDSL